MGNKIRETDSKILLKLKKKGEALDRNKNDKNTNLESTGTEGNMDSEEWTWYIKGGDGILI